MNPQTIQTEHKPLGTTCAVALPPFTLPSDGWLPHDGGPCPVPDRTVVEVKFYCGEKFQRATPADYWSWKHRGNAYSIAFYRVITPAPDPLAEVKAAHKKGKVIEARYKHRTEKWHRVYNPTWTDVAEWRIRPAPRMVPLEPQDVPPGSAVMFAADPDGWGTILQVSSLGVTTIAQNNLATDYTWKELQSGLYSAKINRSIPLTGRWDATAWERCEKEEVQP